VDVLVIGVEKLANGRVGVGPIPSDVDTAFGGRLAEMLSALSATGVAGETTRLLTGGALAAPVLLAVGLGNPAEDGRHNPERLRRAAGAATRALAGTRRVGFALPVRDAQDVGAVAEGALLGAYSYDAFRSVTAGDKPSPVVAVEIGVADLERLPAVEAVKRAEVVASAVHWARDMVNTPPHRLSPARCAEDAVAAVSPHGITVDVVDEGQLAANGFGGIIGVGQGSSNPPRLVRMDWVVPGAAPHIALVGKGITFDSGGLSLKQAAQMQTMKVDMAGAAVVAAAVVAIARLGIPVNVTAWAPLAENMPSGQAQRPSDVLTIYGGRTVEVLNTDAEGRLVLADTIVRAAEERPDLLVDLATLTGAAVTALGHRTSALMSNDDAVRDLLLNAADLVGEGLWPMPLSEELRASLDSPIADIANKGDADGGMLVAGHFLQEFVPDGLRWAHLDIAGPSFNEREAYGYTPAGGTGHGVRTMVRLAELVADGQGPSAGVPSSAGR
jgi:leucyl aminopeptidase